MYIVDNDNLLRDWHWKNNDADPSKVRINSGVSYWWCCENNHEYKKSPARKQRSNCIYCSNQKVWPGFNDVRTRYPMLMKEWNYEQNIIAPEQAMGSTLVWWRCCNDGYEWQTTARNRARGNTNSKISGCPVCANKVIIPGVNDLATVYPEVAKYWNHIKNTAQDITSTAPHAKEKIWWHCFNGHDEEWYLPVDAMARRSTGCPVCENRKVLRGFNDLETRNPLLASQWNYEKNKHLGFGPSEVLFHSRKKVWWICNKNHEWESTIGNRHGGRNCPDCFRHSTSRLEKIVANYINDTFPKLKILRTRRLLRVDGRLLELDIYIPELRLAFEVQDFATHSQNNDKELLEGRFKGYAKAKGLKPYKKGPTYHEQKRHESKIQLDVKLYDLWEDIIDSGEYKCIVNKLIEANK